MNTEELFSDDDKPIIEYVFSILTSVCLRPTRSKPFVINLFIVSKKWSALLNRCPLKNVVVIFFHIFANCNQLAGDCVYVMAKEDKNINAQ